MCIHAHAGIAWKAKDTYVQDPFLIVHCYSSIFLCKMFKTEKTNKQYFIATGLVQGHQYNLTGIYEYICKEAVHATDTQTQIDINVISAF